MKASELRIGNLIGRKYCGKRLENECDVFDLQEMSNKNRAIEFYPIPLTEEWLLKFGFVGWKKQILKTDLFLQVMQDHSGIEVYMSTDIGEGLVTYPNDVIDGIKHVHQLQNLYFALTGEELKIK